MQQLSHANVIFGFDSKQSWDGLRCIVRRLGLVEGAPPPCLIIQAMEDGTPVPKRDEARERFLSESYNVFCDEFYEENEVPDIDGKGKAHEPFPLAYDPPPCRVSDADTGRGIVAGSSIPGTHRACEATRRKGDDRCARQDDRSPEIRQVLLDDLSRFARGGTAETEHDLLKVHLPIPEHRHGARPTNTAGSRWRGAGKTQLFRVLRTLRSPHKLLGAESMGRVDDFEDHYAPGLPSARLPPTQNIQAQLLAGELADPQQFWLGLLVGALLANEHTKATTTSTLNNEQFREAFSDHRAMPSSWLPLVTRHRDRHCGTRSTSGSEVGSRATLSHVAYDDLDILVARVSEAYPLIRGLLAFWLRNFRRWTSLTCKIFLRTDIFEAEEFAFTDSSKLRPLSVTLRWNAGNLYRLVLKRLLNGPAAGVVSVHRPSNPEGSCASRVPGPSFPTTTEDDHKAFMGLLIGQYMGAEKRRGDTYQWFLNHLQDSLGDIAPRSFLKLFELSASRQIGADLPSGDKLLAPVEVSGALMEVSKDRLTELKEEYAWIDDFRGRLKGQTVPMGCADFAKCVRGIDSQQFPEHVRDRTDGLLDYLIGLASSANQRQAEPRADIILRDGVEARAASVARERDPASSERLCPATGRQIMYTRWVSRSKR